MKLSSKILVILAPAALIAVVAVGLLSIIFVRSSLEKSIGEKQIEIAEAAIDKIDRLLDNYYNDVQIIGSDTDLQKKLNNRPDIEDKTLDLRLRQLIVASGPWDSLSLVNTEGLIISSSNLEMINDNISSNPQALESYREALSGKTAFSDLIPDSLKTKPTMYFATPVRDESKANRPIIGVVLGSSSWGAVVDILTNLSGGVYLYNKGRYVIATNADSGVLVESVNKQAREFDLQNTPYYFIGKSINTDKDTLAVIVSEQGFLGYTGNSWGMLYEVPQQEAFAPALGLAWTLSLLFIGLVLIIIALVFFLVTKIVTRPLISLVSMILSISEGDFSKRIPVTSHDEIGHLSEIFNNMSERLEDLYSKIKAESDKVNEALSLQVKEKEKTEKAVLNLLEDIKDEKGKVESVVIERTKELSEEKSRLLASINSLSFSFLIVDIHNKIILKNQALMDLFGMSEKDDVTIKKISEALGGFDIEAEAERCLKGSTVCEMKEIIFKAKILRGIVAPIMTKGGTNEKIGYVLLLEDITEAKVMQRSRDEFFAVASHELRTPLTAIRGNVDMILDSYGDKLVDKDMKDMLTDIEASSVRLIGIVNDFLEVSSLEQGKVQIKNEKFDLDDLITKVERDLVVVVSKKKVALTYVKPDFDVPEVFADKSKVEQVIVNLVGNSLKFTEKGSITVSLSKEDKFIKVTIVDTGLGISEKYQSRLFRKFQQAGEDMIARDVTQGTGLGLYICQLIINAMGGSIKLEKSELGKGSTFSFTLPISG